MTAAAHPDIAPAPRTPIRGRRTAGPIHPRSPAPAGAEP